MKIHQQDRQSALSTASLLGWCPRPVTHAMFFPDILYVQVFASRFLVSNVRSGRTVAVVRDPASVSPRMLIADFSVAQQQLKDTIRSVRRGIRRPEILIHPMERIEGGVTQVEHRVFAELGMGAGGAKVGVYCGPTLLGDAVGQAIREYRH
jgi:rod shape-determining protein MreB